MRHLLGVGVIAVAFVVGCSSQARPQSSNDAVAALKADLDANSIGTTTLTSAELAPHSSLLPWDDARQPNMAPLPAWDDVAGAKALQTWGDETPKADPAFEGLPETRD